MSGPAAAPIRAHPPSQSHASRFFSAMPPSEASQHLRPARVRDEVVPAATASFDAPSDARPGISLSAFDQKASQAALYGTLAASASQRMRPQGGAESSEAAGLNKAGQCTTAGGAGLRPPHDERPRPRQPASSSARPLVSSSSSSHSSSAAQAAGARVQAAGARVSSVSVPDAHPKGRCKSSARLCIDDSDEEAGDGRASVGTAKFDAVPSTVAKFSPTDDDDNDAGTGEVPLYVMRDQMQRSSHASLAHRLPAVFSFVAPDADATSLCMVCRDILAEQDDLGLLQCGHRYCLDCISDWGKIASSCCLCKVAFNRILHVQRMPRRQAQAFQAEKLRAASAALCLEPIVRVPAGAGNAGDSDEPVNIAVGWIFVESRLQRIADHENDDARLAVQLALADEDGGSEGGDSAQYVGDLNGGNDASGLQDWVCIKCQKSDHEDRLLLCDGCDKAWHTYCLPAPLAEVPDGHWICEECLLIWQSFDEYAQLGTKGEFVRVRQQELAQSRLKAKAALSARLAAEEDAKLADARRAVGARHPPQATSSSSSSSSSSSGALQLQSRPHTASAIDSRHDQEAAERPRLRQASRRIRRADREHANYVNNDNGVGADLLGYEDDDFVVGVGHILEGDGSDSDVVSGRVSKRNRRT